MRSFYLAKVLTFSALVCAFGIARADLITNGTFTGTPNTTGPYASCCSSPAYAGDYYDPTTITPWTFSDLSGILQNGGYGAQFLPANPSTAPQFAFIQDFSGDSNAISQTVGDVLGQGYNLSFLLSGSTLSSTIAVIISVDGVPVDTIQAAYGWSGYTIGLVGSGSDTISFSSTDSGNRLAGLTEVSLVATTPEPSSLMLLGTGLLGLAAAGRRKFFNA